MGCGCGGSGNKKTETTTEKNRNGSFTTRVVHSVKAAWANSQQEKPTHVVKRIIKK
jgi:hypothetical protein